jgi:signal peptidase I
MKTARRFVRILFSVAGWAFVTACGAFLVLIGIGPHVTHYQTLTVLSGSMRPGIPVGAIVVVTPESPRDLRVGQIITYQIPVDDHRVVSHRVVKVVEGAGTDSPVFQTKGDANDAPDPWMAKVTSSTVWQVRTSVPGLGRLVFWLRRPGVHTGAVRVVPAALAVLWMITIWRSDPADDIATAPAGAAARA